MTDIADNLKIVLDSIRRAERLSGRSENSVHLLAVSKFHSVQDVLEAASAGVLAFGEYRVQ